MPARTTSVPLLADEHAAFIQGGVSILGASRDAAQVPSIARAHGCRVAPDRRRVTIFLSQTQAATLIDDVRRSGALAVVFSYPPTHRTIQLKGTDAVVRAAGASERAAIPAYVASFVESLGMLGYESRQIQTLLALPDEAIVAVDFTPTAAFDQTPGPKAGAPVQAPA